MKLGQAEYEEWLNNPLTKALKKSFEQAITDPENQPSQYATVTMEMYDRLAAENAELAKALDIVMRYPKINEYMGGQISRIAEAALAKVKESA